MTSTVHSCKTQIKELEGANRTLVLENEDLHIKLRDLSELVQAVHEHPAFRLPPVSTFIEVLRERLDSLGQ